MTLRAVVAGAGGFIGGHLVGYLLSKGYNVTAVDRKLAYDWHQIYVDADNRTVDLKDAASALDSFEGADEIYNLAADMGGMGYISSHRVATLHSVDITSSVIRAAHDAGARLWYASSACVYPNNLQTNPDVVSLKEADAWPADPEPAYGLEKLFGEELAKYYRLEMGMETRIGRLHNVYGNYGIYNGGREKAPAAICRKVIEAKLSGSHEIEIWGDGQQTRSYMHVADCVIGIDLIMHGGYSDPVNLGRSDLVTVNQLVDIVEDIAGVRLKRRYDLDSPQGVRGRNSDNTLIRSLFDWEPQITLREGLVETYAWIYDQMTC